MVPIRSGYDDSREIVSSLRGATRSAGQYIVKIHNLKSNMEVNLSSFNLESDVGHAGTNVEEKACLAQCGMARIT